MDRRSFLTTLATAASARPLCSGRRLCLPASAGCALARNTWRDERATST
jgi:hypothetical protein